ncbi:peptidase C48, SUMO/sentrin/Ubl1 [Tanacetum coccineum]
MRLKSKYVNKTVDPTEELTEDEKLLGRSIFSAQEEEEEEVFNDNEGLILFRMNIKSLAPGLEIDTSVIDVYVSILNYEEKFKMMNMKRHFFYTSMMVPRILEDKTKEIDKKVNAQYDRFHEMMSIQMEDDIEKMQMQDVELAFFPIIAHGHYYLIVFNLKTGKAVIIDNIESDATYDGKYKDNVEFVRSVFGRHMLMYENTNADKILTVAKKPTILKMKWKTKKEKIDCGLYMIMHMELYEGSTAVQWKTGLLPENDKNHQMQMDNLRLRIAAKILLHEVNIYHKKMSDYAKKMTESALERNDLDLHALSILTVISSNNWMRIMGRWDGYIAQDAKVASWIHGASLVSLAMSDLVTLACMTCNVVLEFIARWIEWEWDFYLSNLSRVIVWDEGEQ